MYNEEYADEYKDKYITIGRAVGWCVPDWLEPNNDVHSLQLNEEDHRSGVELRSPSDCTGPMFRPERWRSPDPDDERPVGHRCYTDLFTMFQQDRVMTGEEIRGIIRQPLLAIDAMHKRCILHH